MGLLSERRIFSDAMETIRDDFVLVKRFTIDEDRLTLPNGSTQYFMNEATEGLDLSGRKILYFNIEGNDFTKTINMAYGGYLIMKNSVPATGGICGLLRIRNGIKSIPNISNEYDFFITKGTTVSVYMKDYSRFFDF